MDCHNYSTNETERKKGQHLRMEDRGAIKALRQQGLGIRAIARQVGCAPSTVTNELRRGTPARKSIRGRAPGYFPNLGKAVYEANRAYCHRKSKTEQCRNFISWVVRQVREHKWSLDACCGYARLHALLDPSEMVCTHTLYNMVWSGRLCIRPTELPEALKRKANKPRVGRTKSVTVPAFPTVRKSHLSAWKKATGRAILWLASEPLANPWSFHAGEKDPDLPRIPYLRQNQRGGTRAHDVYGERFSQVFKTITVDNGSEFADFAQIEDWGTKVFFAHPYAAWERPQNERHNGLFRASVPKAVSIDAYTYGDIFAVADELNGRPRRKLRYRTTEELFDTFLDRVFAT